VSKRDDQTCNFLELPTTSLLSIKSTESSKLIYRHYATLYFIFCVDSAESELGILDLIQVFVEALDKSFSNVCELDLIFSSDAINFLLDEIVQSGLVLETNINNIIAKFEEQNKMAKVETSPASVKANSAVSAIKNINLPQLKERVFPNSFKDLKF
jgi:AP-3 complex subunit sigma